LVHWIAKNSASLEAYPDSGRELDQLVHTLIDSAQQRRYTLDEIRKCLETWLPAAPPVRLMVFDPEPALQQIL
jgi:hypothetical protein